MLLALPMHFIAMSARLICTDSNQCAPPVPAEPPPGQAVCSALLNHCYRLLHDLMADLAAAEAEAAQAEQ